MRQKIFPWHGRDFVLLSAEGSGATDASGQTRKLLVDFAESLKPLGLSLDNTVRTRLWARDRASRNLGAQERVRILGGQARSASSSYIAPEHFASDALVALDLLAMKPQKLEAHKILREYEPPKVPLKYLIYDSVVFLSGVIAAAGLTLSEQVEMVIEDISTSLVEVGLGWEKVINAHFYLHSSEKVDQLRKQFRQLVKVEIPQTIYVPVEGYSTQEALVEIEVTALQSN